MKKFASILVTVLFTFSAVVPSFAQKNKSDRVPAVKADFVRFQQADAVSDGNGVLVRWEMASETDNVGFFVYRIEGKKNQLVSDVLIPGSAMKQRGQIVDGQKYEIFDPRGVPGSSYIIESLSLRGQRAGSDPIAAKAIPSLQAWAGHTSDYFEEQLRSRNATFGRNQLALPADLRESVASSQLALDPVNQKWVAAQPGVKIAVKKDGLFRVLRSQLQSAGFDLNTDPTFWRMFVGGVEIPIIIGTNADYVEFLGKGIDTVESDTQIYYLITGNVAGKRMGSRVARPIAGNVAAKNYPQVTVKKERTSYTETIFNGDAENYWGRVITSNPANVNFSLTGIDFTSINSSFVLKMQGFSNGSHSVGVTLNGQVLAPLPASGQVPFSGNYSIPTSLLQEGNNTLQMVSLGSTSDFSFFDTISVSFARKFQAAANSVNFFTQNYKTTQVNGFSSPNVRVFDTTTESEPLEVLNLKIEPNDSLFTVNLPGHRSAVLYAVEESAILAPSTVTANVPSTLSSSSRNATLVIISHENFAAQAQAWADYRRGQGFSVELIDVADIYDEYNYGIHAAAPLFSFLRYARDNWQTQYVLLIGDATTDPRNYELTGANDFVPTRIVTTQFSETGSDDALVDFDFDGLAELSIGRIPARTGNVVTTIFNKVVAFEAEAGRFDRGAAFPFDEPIGYDFADMSQQLRNELPPNYPAVMVDRAAPDSHNTLIDTLNTGKYIVNFSGHGAAGLWGSSSFFTVSHVPQLTNANKQSIFTMLTCLNGLFTQLTVDSLAESLLKSQNGGAVSSWASTGSTTPDIQLLMGKRFFNQLTAGNITRMGDLIRDSKSVIPAGTDVRFSWVLLGDPMLKVRP